MRTFEQFMELASSTPAELNRPKNYLSDHAHRFYETYKVASKLCGDGAEVLSIGAGRAFVEMALAEDQKAKISVFDFEEAIERNKDQYSINGYDCYAGNFLEDLLILKNKKFDVVLFCEILEHIPMPPAKQLMILREFLKDGGSLLFTTPNFANITNCIKLFMGKSIVTSAERLFSPVCAENENVHRREYTMAELRAALTQADYESFIERHIWGKMPTTWRAKTIYILEFIVPRFRPYCLVVGQRKS